jgi:DNA-binding CsgD family transcriptional regulator/uncharacterized protein
LKSLLNADSAGFHLPVAAGDEFYTDDFSTAELDSRPYEPPPPLPDGTCLVKHGSALGVSTLEGAYGAHGALYRTSDYYNEYARPMGKADTLFASTGWGDLTASSTASIQFHRQRLGSRRFAEREVTILRLLYPAFMAGVDTWRVWDRHRSDLLRVIDTAGQAAMVLDLTGRAVHLTPAMAALLNADGAGMDLEARVRAAARTFVGSRADDRLLSPPVQQIETAAARYAMRLCTYGNETSSPLIVAVLERLTPQTRSEEELRSAYLLTPAEARVAVLLGLGRSNAEVARILTISPHTARRHTERVFSKLGVHSRSEVASRVLG